MLTSMKSMLQHANTNNYAIMAVNCVDMEMCRAIITAAKEENAPVIIDVSPRQMKGHADPYLIASLAKQLAEKVHVPVALNLDHGKTLEEVKDSLNAGFTSIMFDGSALPYEENIANTKLLSQLAHGLGISIEAELGHVGIAANGDGRSTDWYTNPEQAKEFVEETGVDCLAVAIGTAHGKYPDDFVPQLDFERLTAIKEMLKMPLVLHGGSGAGEENILKAVECGINKINVCTDLHTHVREKMKNTLNENPTIDYMDLMHDAELAAKEYIKEYMRMIKSGNRYTI